MELSEGVLIGIFAGFGLIFGSFGTVVAFRVPRGESIVAGRSKCPACGHTITAIENVPLFSYLFLRGRCRECGMKISPRYPFIEVVTAVLFALSAAKFDLTVEAVVYAGFFWALVVLCVIDLEERKLPDAITLPLFVVGLAGLAVAAMLDDRIGAFSLVSAVSAAGALAITAVMFPWGRGRSAGAKRPSAEAATAKHPAAAADEQDIDVARPPRPRLNVVGLAVLAAWTVLLIAAFVDGEETSFAGALIGSAVFAGFFFSIAFTYIGGMGGGDIKLALTLGAFAGYLGAPGNAAVAMFLSLLVGGVVSAVVLLRGGDRKSALPFGPFLALGTTLAIFIGDHIQDLYGSTL